MVLKVRCTGVEPTKHIGCKGVPVMAWEKNKGAFPTLGNGVGRLWLARYVGVYSLGIDYPRVPRSPSHRASNLGLRENAQLIAAGYTGSYSSLPELSITIKDFVWHTLRRSAAFCCATIVIAEM